MWAGRIPVWQVYVGVRHHVKREPVVMVGQSGGGFGDTLPRLVQGLLFCKGTLPLYDPCRYAALLCQFKQPGCQGTDRRL